MAVIVVSADQTVAIAPNTGDIIIVEAGVTVSSEGGDALAGFSDTDLLVLVNGVLVGSDNGAEIGGGATVTIGATGALIGKSAGLWLNGSNSVVHNGGIIQSAGNGPSFLDAAVSLNGTNGAAIHNDGTILGSGIGVDMSNSTGTILTNAGSITAGLEAITGDFGARIDNSGAITSARAVAIDLSEAGTGMRLINSGTIAAPIVAIEGTGSTDSARNTGTIDGDVALFNGNDRLSNRGEIFGNVDLGENDDLYRGLGDGLVEGTIFAGAGNDTVRGGNADDAVNGGAGNDSILGGGGDDTLVGGEGNDTFVGGAGDDTLFGGPGADLYVFSGNFGEDLIRGFSTNPNEKIDLQGVSTIVNFNDLTARHLRQEGADTVIDDDKGNIIVLVNFTAANLEANDFIF